MGLQEVSEGLFVPVARVVAGKQGVSALGIVSQVVILKQVAESGVFPYCGTINEGCVIVTIVRWVIYEFIYLRWIKGAFEVAEVLRFGVL